MAKQDKKMNKGIEILLIVFLMIWILLLLLLSAMLTLQLKGYASFDEWKEAQKNEQVQATPAPQQITEEPQQMPTLPPENPVATAVPKPTQTNMEQTAPTEEPLPTPSMITKAEKDEMEEVLAWMESIYPTSGKNVGSFWTEKQTEGQLLIAATYPKMGEFDLRMYVEDALAETLLRAKERLKEQLTAEGTEKQAVLLLNCDSYQTENFASFVYYVIEYSKIDEEEEIKVQTVPFVFDITTGQQRTGRDMFPESYFAVLKGRLMKYVEKEYPQEQDSLFLTYEQPYDPEDYDFFYITEDAVFFYFPENSLGDIVHEAFSYRVELAEAQNYMLYRLTDGGRVGPVIRDLDPTKKMVALTFDDGPYPKVEQRLLEIFEANDARATFFFVGNRIRGAYADMVRKLDAAGHEIGSHTYSHIKNVSKNVEQFWYEVNASTEILTKTMGHAPRYLRMPGGEYIQYTHNLPYPMISWCIDSLDYTVKRQEDAAQIIFDEVAGKVRDGDIVLMHSLYGTTADAVEMLLPYLKEKGFQFVTVSELFYYKGKTTENGERYFSSRQ